MEFEDPKSSKKLNASAPTNIKRSSSEEKCICQLKNQMEYYFSDANLSRDKHLTELIDRHGRGYVEVIEFLKFNRIKDIVSGYDIPILKALPLITKGVERSDKLQLNKLGDKVKRKLDFVYDDNMRKDMNKKSVYVENLVPSVTMEHVSEIFKKCGTIVSVDLPKFANNSSKGFAFVQFSTTSSAEDALRLNNATARELCSEAKSAAGPLRVLSHAEWAEHKKKFNDLKSRLMNVYTENKKDKDYIYFKILLNYPATGATKDEIELYFKQIDVDVFYVDIVGKNEVVVKVWDYSAYKKVEKQLTVSNELLNFISRISFLSEGELREYLSKIKTRKDKLKSNKKTKKMRRRS